MSPRSRRRVGHSGETRQEAQIQRLGAVSAWKSGHRDAGADARGEQPATGLEGRECGARSPGAWGPGC